MSFPATILRLLQMCKRPQSGKSERRPSGLWCEPLEGRVLLTGVTLPFSDNFTTVTSPEPDQLTSNWVNQAGNFNVNTGTGTATGKGSLDVASLVGLNAPNVAAQAAISVTKGESAALVADDTGAGTYYFGGVT